MNETQNEITVLDLFSGIGGFTLAGEIAGGFRTIAFSDIDTYACAVLAHRFPGIPNLGSVCDITRDTLFSATGQRTVDLITGGFPCQPHSVAGLRKAGDDERDLWAECARLLRDIRPKFALFENVGGLLTSEDISSDGERASGLFFNRVLSDLSELGYGVLWQVVPAEAVGAPHRRDRIWIICVDELVDTSGTRWQTQRNKPIAERGTEFVGESGQLADTDHAGDGASSRGTDGHQSAEDFDRRQSLAESCGLGKKLGDPQHTRRDAAEIGTSDTAGGDRDSCGTDSSGEPAGSGDEQLANPDMSRRGELRRTEPISQGQYTVEHGGIDHLWPARPGQAQFGWEAPRVVANATGGKRGQPQARDGWEVSPGGGEESVGNATGARLQGGERSESARIGADLSAATGLRTGEGDNGQVKSDLGGKFDGLPTELDTTAIQVQSQDPTENRVGRLKALGNAIVPQVATIMLLAIRDQFAQAYDPSCACESPSGGGD